MTLLVILNACGSGPTVTSVSPAEALPGADIQVLGEALPASATVTLVQGEASVVLTEVRPRGALLIEATLPADLAPGAWTVRVSGDGLQAEAPDPLTVPEPVVERPCGGDWKTNAQVSKARQVVVIDRFGPDEARETLRLDFADIEGVQYELVALDDDRLCSVIYIQPRGGQRVSFDDDTRLNLAPRAYRVGNAIGKPVTVTRADRDVATDPRPVESD